jgi:pyruvate/2-oxoglutarate/acetoin dehydrogenase E1 component
MTYKDYLHKTMLHLAKDPLIRFIGYNSKYGHQFNGTLKGCENSCIETPVAENLICGLGMGLALEGYQPILLFERMDFLWVCADAIINHLDKAKQLGWPPLNVIIRTCVGADTPLDPGCQHKGDYTEAFKLLLSAPVLAIKRCEDVAYTWETAMAIRGPVMVIEYRELYPTLTTVSSKLYDS